MGEPVDLQHEPLADEEVDEPSGDPRLLHDRNAPAAQRQDDEGLEPRIRAPANLPSQVSRGMYVRDVSERNDWTKVRLESQPTALGRVYTVAGFIRKRAG